MTEETETAAPEAAPMREIEFYGRTMWVHLPSPEQLLVWKRTVARLQELNPASWTGDEVLAALERARRIVDSLLEHEADKDWLDDQMLDRKITSRQTTEIITKAVEAFADQSDDNREARRAAKKAPAKKAARKRPAS